MMRWAVLMALLFAVAAASSADVLMLCASKMDDKVTLSLQGRQVTSQELQQQLLQYASFSRDIAVHVKTRTDVSLSETLAILKAVKATGLLNVVLISDGTFGDDSGTFIFPILMKTNGVFFCTLVETNDFVSNSGLPAPDLFTIEKRRTEPTNGQATWEPDQALLFEVEPLIKDVCWSMSDQRRKIASTEIEVEIPDATNIMVFVPSFSTPATFTIRGLAYAGYFRSCRGFDDGRMRYLAIAFSPTPVTNDIPFGPTIISDSSWNRVDGSPIPRQFKVYVDLSTRKAYDERDWLKHLIESPFSRGQASSPGQTATLDN